MLATDILGGALAASTRSIQPCAFNTVTRAGDPRAAALDATARRGRNAPRSASRSLKDNLCTRGMRRRRRADARELRSLRRATVVSRLRASRRHLSERRERGVRDGIVDGEAPRSDRRGTLGPGSHSRRIERRVRAAGGAAAIGGRARVRHRELHPSAGGALRVTGLKPTTVACKRYGLPGIRVVAGSNRTVDADRVRCGADAERDCGRDAADATSSSEPVADHGGLDEARSAVCASASGVLEGCRRRGSSGVRASLDTARCERRQAGGYRVAAKHAIGVYYLIATAEASSNLARCDGVRYGFRFPPPGASSTLRPTRDGVRPRGKRRIMLGVPPSAPL